MTRRAPLLLLAGLLGSCASHESFSVSVLRPAPVDLGKHRLLAVDRFAGPSGQAVSGAFGEAFKAALAGLQNPLSQERRGFEIVHRKDVDQMIDDMRRYPKAGLDRDPESPIARWKRAEIVLAGVIGEENVDENVVGQAWKDRDGSKHTTFVRRASANFEVTIEAKAQDGRLIDRALIRERSDAATKAVDSEPAPIDHNALIQRARDNALARYLRRIAPHEDRVLVRLFTDGELPQLAVGNGFARIGDWESAHSSYDAARARATGKREELSYKASYNVGIALLYLNRFAEARDALKTAYASSQDRSILAQLATVTAREQEFELLREQSGRARPAR